MTRPNPQKRPYRQKKRAELTSLTRQRIVEAAIDLHGSVGPARTTISMIADRAGVQRHTLYAHFPDERSLLLACSGLLEARDPLPDAVAWRAVAQPASRLKTGLGTLYAWYGRNARLMSCVLRDAEHHALVRDIVTLRITPAMTAMQEVLSEGLDARQISLLRLALSFYTWRSLVSDSGLSHRAAIETLVVAIFGQETSGDA